MIENNYKVVKLPTDQNIGGVNHNSSTLPTSQAGQRIRGESQSANCDTISNNYYDQSCVTAKIYQELLDSGISPEVIDLNVSIVNELEIDPVSQEVIATPIHDFLGWPYTRFTQNARPTMVALLLLGWQAKVFNLADTGQRTGKYYAPKDIGDVPFTPIVPTEIALQAAAKVSPELEASLSKHFEDDGEFWEWFKEHKELPLLVTEGAKKALSITSQGHHIAIALYGCNCGVTKGSIKPELLPYVQGRTVTIAFDRDEKPETRYKVFKATRRLGSAFKHHAHAQVAIASWDGTKGKGIDDLIANDPTLFHQAITEAQSFDKWRLGQYTDLSRYNPITVNQEHLDINIPDNARFIAFKSPRGTGKTESIAKKIAEALDKGIPVIVLSHREQLVRELSNRFGVAYRTELKNSEQGSLFGYGLCIDSLHGKANPPFHPESWEGCWVIIDEAEQVIWHLLNSNTCQYNRVPILETFTELLNVSAKIFLADADLSKITLDLVTRLLDEPVQPWLVVNEWQATNRKAVVYELPETLLSKLLDAIRNGDRVMVHTGAQKVDSKWGTINLESLIKKTFPDKKVLRIDAESVATPGHPAYGCMGNLNAVLAEYDVVIASPTIETGVSIECKHFDGVFCFATGSQTVEAVGQTLARVRANVIRHIWVKERSSQRIANGSDSPRSLMNSQDKLFKANCAALSQVDAIASFDDEDKDPQYLKTWATLAALKNYGFKNYRQSVLELLEADGYELEFIEARNDQEDVLAVVTSVKNVNYQTYCEQVSQAPILDDIEHKRVKNKRAKTDAERLAERKTTIADRFDTEEVTPELVKADDKGLYGQMRLHYYLTVGNTFVKQRDTNKAQKISANGKIFGPDLNKVALSLKVSLLKLLGIEQFLSGDRVLSNDDETLKQWHDDLVSRHRNVIREIFGNSFNPENHTPIRMLAKLLKLLGLKLSLVSRRRVEGVITRFYQLSDPAPMCRTGVFERWFERDQANCCDTTFININDQSCVTPNDQQEAA